SAFRGLAGGPTGLALASLPLLSWLWLPLS
ncbi:hypothetical protein, partial [Brucella abortus]